MIALEGTSRERIAVRVGRIAARIRALAARDPYRQVFGAEGPTGHDYRLGAALSEEALRTFEARARVRLPAAYRAFVSRVGDGGAGPGYGLLPLARATEGRRVDEPFPHRAADAADVMRRRCSGREPYAFVGADEDDDDDDDAPGAIALCDDGCRWHTYLVVSGEQRGKVWAGGESGWCPHYFVRNGEPVQHTFLSWYEAWLRRAWRETRAQPFQPPTGKCVNLRGKVVGALPAALFECAEVEELSLSANKLRSVPPAIGRLRGLRTLDLGGNLLESLPDAIGELVALEELRVAYNRLGVLPEAIGALASLRVLAVQSNPLRELPASMVSLRSLRRLALGNTAMRRLPSWLSTLELDELQLDGVHLDEWDDLRAFRDRGSLKRLWLSRIEELDRIPDAVFEIGSLEHLVLGGTSIGEIPPAIARLRGLRSIGLANTPLRRLPDELGALPLLARIVLQGAQLAPGELERARARWSWIDFA